MKVLPKNYAKIYLPISFKLIFIIIKAARQIASALSFNKRRLDFSHTFRSGLIILIGLMKRISSSS